MSKFLYGLLFFSAALMISCQEKKQTGEETEENTTAKNEFVLVSDSSFFDIIGTSATLETVAEGFEWSEGPVWVPQINSVLFSDVLTNQIFKWNEIDSLTEYLNPSGYTGEVERGAELGSNGLTLDLDGNLVLCQHGDRRVARMASSVDIPASEFETIADNWEGKKFNSPNDLCFASNGNLYFTDPPYGLVQQENDPAREISFQGVYLAKPNGEVAVVVDSLTRPNGIALTPDESQIVIANSDPEKVKWYIYDVNEDGTLGNGSELFDAGIYAKDYPGLPDGLKIDSQGNIFASGPGGIHVFDNEHHHLGIILTSQATANCSFGSDEKTLFITADMYLMKLQMNP